jgi:hypothetical protein
MSIVVKAEGPIGRAKIRSDDPKHALGLAQYLRTIGYSAWIEDTNGNLNGLQPKAGVSSQIIFRSDTDEQTFEGQMRMFALGQERALRHHGSMSALPPKADIG